MKVLLTALLLGVVSMIIVFVAGLTSGVVRLTTLAFRAIFAFAMTSAASYFLMMLYDLYEELKMKKMKKALEEVEKVQNAEDIETEKESELDTEKPATEENQSEQPEAFQPISADNLPNVGK